MAAIFTPGPYFTTEEKFRMSQLEALETYRRLKAERAALHARLRQYGGELKYHIENLAIEGRLLNWHGRELPPFAETAEALNALHELDPRFIQAGKDMKDILGIDPF